MGKFKMPSAEQLYNRRRKYGPKKDPVWVYLEHEMQERDKQGLKPYNKKVGKWLLFCRDLRRYFYLEKKRIVKRLDRDAGPAWFEEFSVEQRHILTLLKAKMREDAVDQVPDRTKKCLRSLGIMTNFPNHMVMSAITEGLEDPGLLFWHLFTKYYGQTPGHPLPKYDHNSRLMMSALVFIDLEDTTEELRKLTANKVVKVTPPAPKKPKPYYEPKVKFGAYLQNLYVPYYNPWKESSPPTPQMEVKVRVHKKESYIRMALQNEPKAIKKRYEKNAQRRLLVDRTCNYKFWIPPVVFRSHHMTPKQLDLAIKMDMWRKKANPKSLRKYLPEFDNLKCCINGVSYSSGKPIYMIHQMVVILSKYAYQKGEIILFKGSYVIQILGMCNIAEPECDNCQKNCTCLKQWGEESINFLLETKCKCQHGFDFYNEGQLYEQYVHKSTKYGAYWIDHAKIYQLDPWEDFIKKEIESALDSEDKRAEETTLCELKPAQLLQAFLAELTDTYLLIPHLPDAYRLNSLQEWVRKRVFGKLTPQEHRQLFLQSGRRWAQLNHIDFRARANNIFFSAKELEKFTFLYRPMLQQLYTKLLQDFKTRNQKKLMNQTRLFWPTMKFDEYPGKSFLEIFFTYMPQRPEDIHLLNPYKQGDTKSVQRKRTVCSTS